MTGIFVLAEHRQGQVRDITFEMLTKGRELAQKIGAELSAVIFGKDVKDHAKTLASSWRTSIQKRTRKCWLI